MKRLRWIHFLWSILPVLGCSGSGSQGSDPGVPPEDAITGDLPDETAPGEDPAGGDLLESVDMGPDAPPCFRSTSDWGFQEQCDGTVLDTRTRLLWEKTHAHASGLIEARNRCEASQTGGFEDWRLPTIDELRTLILGCPATTAGGPCPVTHAGGRCEDRENSACWTEDCRGCATNQGPVTSPTDPNRRCYQDATFDWQCSLPYWSDTQVQAKDPQDRRSWYVTFYDAGIDVPPTMNQVGYWAVRCVRGPLP